MHQAQVTMTTRSAKNLATTLPKDAYRRPQCKHRMCAAGPRPGWARLRFSCLSGFFFSCSLLAVFCFVLLAFSSLFTFCHFFLSSFFYHFLCMSACVRVPVCVCFVCVCVCVCDFQNVKMWVKKVKKKKTHQPSRSSEGCKGGLMQNTMTWGEEKK